MHDLLKTFPPILLSGFVILAFSRFRLNAGFSKLNGEKFVVQIFAWGTLSYCLYILTKFFLLKNFDNIATMPPELKELSKYSFFLLSGVLIGGILGDIKIRGIIEESGKWFISNKYPAYTNQFEEDMLRAIYLERVIYILETKANKVYIGYFVSADFDDYTSFEEKIIRFKPLLSGKRGLDHKIEYSVEYLSKNMLKKAFLNTFNEEELEEYREYIDDDKNLVIFTRELVSYRKLDSDLLKKFHSYIFSDDVE